MSIGDVPESHAPHVSINRSPPALLKRALAVLATIIWIIAGSGTAWADAADVQTAWRLLDYIAVDYSGAVSAGHVKSASEYAEMTEFAASVSARLASLPANPARPDLIARAFTLQGVIAAKDPPTEVARLAQSLAADLLKAYPVPLAPAKAPDLAPVSYNQLRAHEPPEHFVCRLLLEKKKCTTEPYREDL